MAYTANKPTPPPSADELRARIPGWGADLDPADRPSYPKERSDLPATGAHWDFPDRQETDPDRERSIEHKFLTPVYGTAQPLHGVSGAIRRYAYRNYSEGVSTHWLLLVLGDRVEAIGAHIRSLASLRPDDPVTQSGVLSEAKHRPISSRFGRGRVDVRHTWLDPIVVVGPWVLAGTAVVAVVRRIIRRR